MTAELLSLAVEHVGDIGLPVVPEAPSHAELVSMKFALTELAIDTAMRSGKINELLGRVVRDALRSLRGRAEDRAARAVHCVYVTEVEGPPKARGFRLSVQVSS